MFSLLLGVAYKVKKGNNATRTSGEIRFLKDHTERSNGVKYRGGKNSVIKFIISLKSNCDRR